jgi:hypothetical protein
MSERQAASAVAMVRPAAFASNPETLATNRFQRPGSRNTNAVADAARREFDALAEALEAAGVAVHCFAGQRGAALADEVFPNNWLSLHADGTAVLYPMMAQTRRPERRREILDALGGALGYGIARIVDLTPLEARGSYLEGTGSLVLDRPHRTAYASLSARTDPAALEKFAAELGYQAVPFRAAGRDGHAIYHTNVLLSIGTHFAVLCSAAIGDPRERRIVLDRLRARGREVLEIGFGELEAFAGNLLELEGHGGPVIALSTRAADALDPSRRRALEAHGRLVVADVGTIETFGGGSVRCMLTEVHLPRAPA